ncbi:MAG TPA: replicative DNA helicase [Anaerolineae bacterium]|nr:replicative DNA helicase [Anaerolineae bacterium]
MSAIERLPPHNLEAEEAVLGSLLIDPDAIYDVANFLHPRDFYKVQNGWIYEAILALNERREPLDLLTLTDELRRREQLEEIGGEAVIIGLVNAVPTSVNAAHYGRIVEAASTRRQLINAASSIANLAYEEAEDISIVIDRAEQALFSVSEERTTRDLTPISQIARDYLERIEKLTERGEDIIGVPTGFSDLDRLLGGLNKSDLLILAARPGMGKTSLQNAIALTAATRYGKRIAIFNLEMSGEQLVQRMLSAETRIDSQRLRRGQLHEHEWPIFMEAIGRLSQTRIFIDDTPSITPNQLRTKCRRLYAEHGLDLIMIDYLQLMVTERGSNNRVQEISEISRGLKGLARELDVPVLAAAQLSRAVEQRQDKRPLLSDLRDSGCLTGDSLVTLADSGRRVPIRNLAGQAGFSVWALNEETLKLETAVVSRAFSTGVKPVYLLQTQLGRTIKATANHKFRAFTGWKRLDELSINDYLALPREIHNKNKQTMSDSELALLGHLIGDGCVLPRHAIQYTTREEDLAEVVVSLASNVFPGNISPRIRQERSWYQVYLASTRHHTHGVRNVVSEWFEELGIFGLRSFEKFVPDVVFEQPPEAIAVFLRHLWATDGCIKCRMGNGRAYPAVYYASSSQQLAQDVQSLLLRLGITARIKCLPQINKGRDQFHVVVSGQEDLEKFVYRIDAVGQYKSQSLAEIKQYITNRAANTNRDVIPHTFWREYVVPVMQANGITSRQMQADIGQSYCGTSLYKQNVSRARAVRVAQAIRSDKVEQLATSDIYWDKIVSITYYGEEEVFDLTVPGLHNFAANDIIVHNSIEQDADIVMFIYRDEYYNPDTTERPNIAELNIAKHRNGPTGTIDLYWHSKLATFRNLQRQEINL